MLSEFAGQFARVYMFVGSVEENGPGTVENVVRLDQLRVQFPFTNPTSAVAVGVFLVTFVCVVPCTIARVRLLGVGSSKLSPAEQRDLFSSEDNSATNSVDEAVDDIRDRFGNLSVGRARTLERP